MLFLCLVTIVFLVVSLVAMAQDADWWVSATCWTFFGFSLVGIVELLTSYVILDELHLRIRKNFRLTVLQRAEIETVNVAKGCPVTLTLKDGRYVKIPDLGTRNIGNSLRAWIRST